MHFELSLLAPQMHSMQAPSSSAAADSTEANNCGETDRVSLVIVNLGLAAQDVSWIRRLCCKDQELQEIIRLHVLSPVQPQTPWCELLPCTSKQETCRGLHPDQSLKDLNNTNRKSQIHDCRARGLRPPRHHQASAHLLDVMVQRIRIQKLKLMDVLAYFEV